MGLPPAANQKIVSGQLTLAAAAQRLSNVYGGNSVNNAIDPSADVPLRELHLYAESAAIFTGKNSDVTSTVYGETAASGTKITLGPWESGGVKLSDIWIAGSGATVHVFGVAY